MFLDWLGKAIDSLGRLFEPPSLFNSPCGDEEVTVDHQDYGDRSSDIAVYAIKTLSDALIAYLRREYIRFVLALILMAVARVAILDLSFIYFLPYLASLATEDRPAFYLALYEVKVFLFPYAILEVVVVFVKLRGTRLKGE